MRQNPRFFRLTAGVALTALLWDALVPIAAVAQPAPPPLPPLPQPYQAQPDQNQSDPPARVGRIARISGTVSFHNQGDTQWSPASVNYPVSAGNSFWTEPSAEAQLEVADSRIALAGGTEFDVTTLDTTGLQGVAGQGETYIHLRDLAPNEAWSVQTPRGLVRLEGAGRYDIVVGTTEQPTLVTVLDGAAQIEGPGVSLQLAGGQTATITGTDTFQGSVGPALRDAFLTAKLAAEQPPHVPPVAIPAQVAAMPGGGDLAGYGNWSEAPDYGQVWYPPVSPGWVPYREGHWAYVAPWGWTWIDDAPWGFAPFHYGRWVEIGGRWAWTPGGIAVAGPPVYAPALVTFIGIGAGVALGAALAAGTIGWVPLGPREPFRPWYHASDRYLRQVNVGHVTTINNNITINNYINRGAATSIPAAAMTGSRPVQSVARPVTARDFAGARPIVGQQPVRPTAATAGVTPTVARQLNLAPTAPIRPAPGPAVRSVTPGPAISGFSRPGTTPVGRTEPGNPASHPVGGSPPAQPLRPIEPNHAPGPLPSGSQPPGVPAQQAGRPAQIPPTATRPAETGFARPGGIAPASPHPAPVGTPAAPVPVPHAESRPLPQVITPSRPEARPEAPHFAPAAPTPRPEPQHAAPAAPMPHPEPQHFAPAAMPHQETPHFAPSAARPEPSRAAAPAPAQHDRKPNGQ
ncbi:MAG: hypothetical protein P4L90_19125 [Rhodopila sp.]|nr:hypothetical protein [Rhodopila sp.]